MKRILIRLFVAAGLTFGIFLLSSARSQQAQQGPVLALSNTGQEPAFPTAPSSPDSQDQSAAFSSQPTEDETQNALTFTGRIQDLQGMLLLIDPVTKISYRLDDQSRVRHLRGKHVKVIGKLRMMTNTIRIESVELLP